MKLKKVIIYASLSILGVIVLSLFFAYFTNFNDPVANFFKKIYPSVIIDGKKISIYSLNQKVQLAKNVDSKASVDLITNQIINNFKLSVVAQKFNIFPDEVFLTNELSFYSKNQESDYKKLIDDSFNSNSELFRENILIPLATEASLRIKYNTESQLVSLEYKKAQSLLDQIQQGKEFELVAKESSDDLESGQLGGDLGFFTSGEVIPELEKQIVNAKPGSVLSEIVVSRLGYHIIYPIESAFKDGNKYWHVKHILIKTEGFNAWLGNQLNSVKVWSLVK